MQAELTNLRILLTRQTAVDDLAQKIADLGGSSVHLPLFAIESTLDATRLPGILQKFRTCSLAICISRNAAEIILPDCSAFTHVRWATIGPSTMRILQQNGINDVICPQETPYDSPTLLEVFKLNNINLENQYIMVFTGEQGDDWLAQALVEKKAKVEVVTVYKRVMPAISNDQFKKIFSARPGIDIILITCITSLANLIQLANAATLEIREKPLLVVSRRIYEYAVAQGFTKVYTAQGMSEPDILSALAMCR